MPPEQLMQKLSSLEREKAELSVENLQLKAQLEWFKRHFFGTGKSESIDALQLRLNFPGAEKEASESETQTQQISYERKKAFVSRESRAEHFKDVPVKETVELIPEQVKADPEAWVRIGQEETFEIDIRAPKLFKRRIIRPKYRNRFNREMPPVLAPAPVRAVSGGYASAGLLVWVTLSKYLDHLPLYRLEKMSERWGARLSRQAMSDWVEAVSQWFEPIYGLMRRELLHGGYVQADETPVNFLDPELKMGKAQQGYLWVIGKPGGNVVFDWRLSRRHDEATTLLEGFEGVLQRWDEKELRPRQWSEILSYTMKTKPYKTIIGVDLGDKKHHICVTDKDGSVLCEKTITNRKAELVQLAKEYEGSLIAIEVGAHSPWISRLIQENGCSCLVANARKLRAIYENDRKCDALDARMLAKLARVDPELLSPIQHSSEQCQLDRLVITLRDSLVRQRVNIISTIRFSLKSLGISLPSCSSWYFHKYCREALEGSQVLNVVESSLQALEALNTQIKNLDKQIAQTALNHYPQTKVLEKIPGVGPITSLSFVLAIGGTERFKDPRNVGAYLGLVPRRDQSGKSDKQLPITKAGNANVRRLLVQCAQYILGRFGPDCQLREYGLSLAARGGKAAKKKAVIAVARKLAVLMLVLWKNEQPYQPYFNSVN